ncbi:MAG: hypothetical protein JKY11_04795 [Alphaproteobacteria bacterium]|nr:hypothetical protein [Alphaproteobacteria bacterium]
MTSLSLDNSSFSSVPRVQVKKSTFSGYVPTSTSGELTDRSYVAQTSGTASMFFEGLVNGDIGTATTGLLNTIKNAGYFGSKKIFNNASVDNNVEGLASAKADTLTAGVGMASNSFQLVGAIASGDPTYLMSGILACGAYLIQTADGLREVCDKSKPSTMENLEKKFPFIGTVTNSTFGGAIKVAVKKTSDLVFKFAETAKDNNMDAAMLGIRAGGTLTVGVVTGNPLMIATGAGLSIGALIRAGSNIRKKYEKNMDVLVGGEDTEEEQFSGVHGETLGGHSLA